MEENKKVRKNKTLFTALKNAINGIIHVFKTERNLRIDYLIGALVFIFSLFFDFSKAEYVCLIITIGFMIFAEMINSVIEYMVDLITEEYNEKAKAAKDIAAGGVLIAGGISVIVAYFLFADKIKEATMNTFATILNSKAHMLVTILFIVVIFTIVIKGMFKKAEKDYVQSFPSSRIVVSFALATYLFIITNNFIVGAVSLVLSIIIASLKKETDKISNIHVLLSAALGILLVIIIYQLTEFGPLVLNVKLW